MEKDYENVKGWLGLIIGDKIFVNFTKYSFDECMRRLKSELAYYLFPSSVLLNDSASSHDQKTKPEEWTEAECACWFKENNLNMTIFESLKPCNGMILKEMFKMKKNSSDFFYKSLKEIEHLKLSSIISFSSYLEKLFTN